MSKHETTCIICDSEQLVDEYGDWTCNHCGQRYNYDEGHAIRLTEEQVKLLQEFNLAAATQYLKGQK